MSSIGFPDGQRITQWLGAPIVQQTALAIGNVLHTDGPFNLASWASVIVAIKPTGGNVTVTVRQRVSGGPASLELPETFIVQAGQVGFESIVLFGDAVYLDLTGSAPGVTVDYALYPSNTTTNAQVLASATVNVQHNEALVAAEPTLDFVDSAGNVWVLTDDAANTRMKVALPDDVACSTYPPTTLLASGLFYTVPNLATVNDPRGMNGANKITVPVAGWYHVTGTLWFAAAGGGTERVLRITGSNGLSYDDRKPPWGGDWNVLKVDKIVKCAAGDWFNYNVFQDSGGAINWGGTGGGDLSSFAVAKVGR